MSLPRAFEHDDYDPFDDTQYIEADGLQFFLNVLPGKTTAQHKGMMIRGGKPIFFKNKKQVAESNTLSGLLAQHAPDAPFDGPTALTIEVTWPFRKAEPKRNRLAGRMPHVSKPDIDNWVKDFIDLLVKMRFVEDDACICELTARKFWGEGPGINVWIRKVAE